MVNYFKALFYKVPWAKLILFFSAYSPLLFIIGVKFLFKTKFYLDISNCYFNISIPIISIVAFSSVILSIILFNKTINSSKSPNENFVEIFRIEEMNEVILTYLIPYLFSFNSINTIEDVFGGLIIFFIILLIYVNSEILYINPIFLAKHYNFYKVSTNMNNVLLISKVDINREIGRKIAANRLTTRVYIVGADYE